jgi:5'-methylthioadenosine phosphorylase
MTTAQAELGVIGGSGFYALEGLDAVERISIETPFGTPSADFVLGTLYGRRVAFLARHGEGHRILPSELPARANIWALKSLGIERVLAVSAVGSLQQRYEPMHAVVPDQLIDRTRGRASTFFGEGLVAHISFGDPYCKETNDALASAAEDAGVITHRGGTLIVTDGPAFSSRAESELYRTWGGAIIGMTALPEAKLAREAELCYGGICFVTDYDVWHDTEEDVSASLVMGRMQENAARGAEVIRRVVETLPAARSCACATALDAALVTPRELVPEETRRRLAPLLEPHWGPIVSSASGASAAQASAAGGAGTAAS